LKGYFLHREIVLLQFPRNDWLQIRPLWHRPQPEHFLQLPAVFAALGFPIFLRVDVDETTFGERGGFGLKIIGEHFVAR